MDSNRRTNFLSPIQVETFKEKLKTRDRFKRKQEPKFIDSGNDPIITLRSNTISKRIEFIGAKKTLNPMNRPVVKSLLQPVKKTSQEALDARSSTFGSNEKPSDKTKTCSLVVRDFGVQCTCVVDEKPKGGIGNIHAPITSLQSVLGKLKRLQCRLSNKLDKNAINSLVSDLDHAVKMLSNHSSRTSSIHTHPQRISPLHYKGHSKFSKLVSFQQQNSKVPHLDKYTPNSKYEKEDLTKKLIEKSKELEERLRQILDLQVKLEESRQSCSAMATKLGVFSMTIETLEARVKSLEDDNKRLRDVEESRKLLLKQLSNMSKEKEKLNVEIQLMLLEREKNRTLLQIRGQELAHLKNEDRNLSIVSNDTGWKNELFQEQNIRLEQGDTKYINFPEDFAMNFRSKSQVRNSETKDNEDKTESLEEEVEWSLESNVSFSF